MPRMAPNVEPGILRSLAALLDDQNTVTSTQPGAPRVHVAHNRQDLAQAARVMAQAFVRQADKGWLAWLRPADVQRIRAGDLSGGEAKIGRVILYLLHTALRSGGMVTLETALDASQGRRVVRGAALRTLPCATVVAPSRVREIVFGGWAALRSYGWRRTFAAEKAAADLKRATQAMRVREGIPLRCIYGDMLCVHPAHEGQGVASRLSRPLQQLADRHALFYLLQSSNPERNDARVFKGFGFEHTGAFVYGDSALNSVGAYVITLMVRKPAALADAACGRDAQCVAPSIL